MLALFTYTVFGFDIPTDVIIAILVVNTILLVVAVVGFTNLRLQIRDLKSLINRIKAKQKELRE
jgi:hypothetical protein